MTEETKEMSEVKVSVEGIEGRASHRTLHFFWIVDCSGSMVGTKIQTVNYAINNVIPEIKRIVNAQRLNVLMYVIRFGDLAEWHIGPDGLTIEEFQKNWKDLDANMGLTNTPDAVNLLIGALDSNKLGKRNIPPVCILLSDGYCNEPGYEDAINQLNNLPWGKKAVRLSIGIEMDGASYNKDELDMFISPYLRKDGVETLHADSADKLVKYIKKGSTCATQSASKSRAVDSDSETTPPVQINKAALESDDDLDEDIDAGDVF